MKKVMLLLVMLSTYFMGIAQQSEVPLSMKVDLVFLASDYLEGREAGSKGEQMAAQYIAKRFQEIGLKAAGVNGTWYQSFDFVEPSNPHVTTGEDRVGKNVAAFIDNGAATTVVIGAHFDHLGRGAFGSRYLEGPAIHNGADDNASGTSALIYIAEQLMESTAKSNNYLFLAFSAEELGLLGSKHYVNNPTMDLTKVNYMINMDMVGRLKAEKTLTINGAGTSPVWKESFDKIESGMKVQTTDSGIGPSDHTSFYLKDIPVLHFFTGQHKEYHKPGDDASTINYEGMVAIADYIVDLVELLDDKGKIAFTKTKDEDESRKAASFKVTLGVMPDYATNGEGMRVDAVLDDRPADKAGIKDGDVIIQMGEMKIGNIYDYMEGLSKFKTGEKTIVKVKRGNEIIEKEVTF
jgi:Zn-dependent M28 family amino/carboxypeptidase